MSVKTKIISWNSKKDGAQVVFIYPTHSITRHMRVVRRTSTLESLDGTRLDF